MDEDTLKNMFEKSQTENPEKLKFSAEESTKFKKAFEDPEFRRMFAEYMDELQDPKHREENEAYISQLEGEEKVPEGKELIRPEPGFVAKTFKNATEKTIKEKVFINIVQSTKISIPTKESTGTSKGDCWSVPYSLGPPHMEKDKNGENAPCFDCCFHPEALRLGGLRKEFRDLLVNTAIDGIEQVYTQQKQDVKLNREFHILKGISYKQGTVPTMLIATASKEKWNEKNSSTKKPEKKSPKPSKTQQEITENPEVMENEEKKEIVSKMNTKGKSSPTKKKPAMKKGFLNNSKTEIYGDKLTTIRGKKEKSTNNIALTPTPDNSDNLLNQSDIQLPSENKTGTPLVQEIKENNPRKPSKVEKKEGLKKNDGVNSGLNAVSTRMKTRAARVSENQPLDDLKEKEEKEVSMGDQREEWEENGFQKPKFTLKERGKIDLGDFERLQAGTVASNRPKELVLSMELPLVVKASQVELDVAVREVKLRYQDIYRLTVPLPYPVLDEKGTAKYDKNSKCLIVTLPVMAHEITPVIHKNTNSDKNENELSESKVQELKSSSTEEESKKNSSSTSTSSKNSPIKKRDGKEHNRWIEKENVEKSEEKVSEIVEKPTKSLKEEILEQAELALKNAKLSTEMKVNLETTKEKTKTPVENEFNDVLEGVSFFPSEVFQGKKTGFVFKRSGDLKNPGVLGYYLEGFSNSPTQLSVGSTSKKVINDFSWTARDSKPAIALLIEIPKIDPNSVIAEFHERSFTLSFQVNTENETFYYGARFVLNSEIVSKSMSFNVKECKYDVAGENMVLVLKKEAESHWQNSKGKSDNSLLLVEPLEKSGEKENETAEEESKGEENLKTINIEKDSLLRTQLELRRSLESSVRSMEFSSIGGGALLELD